MKHKVLLLILVSIATLLVACSASSTSPIGVNCKLVPMQDINPDCMGR